MNPGGLTMTAGRSQPSAGTPQPILFFLILKARHDTILHKANSDSRWRHIRIIKQETPPLSTARSRSPAGCFASRYDSTLGVYILERAHDIALQGLVICIYNNPPARSSIYRMKGIQGTFTVAACAPTCFRNMIFLTISNLSLPFATSSS